VREKYLLEKNVGFSKETQKEKLLIVRCSVSVVQFYTGKFCCAVLPEHLGGSF
jgi:hypothetical protein